MQRYMSRGLLVPRTLRNSISISLISRPYFTLEALESVAEVAHTIPGDVPRAFLKNGRFVTTLCGGNKKSFSDVANWLWTSKQSRLSLPSLRYHDRHLIKSIKPDFNKIDNRNLTKLTWVNQIQFRLFVCNYYSFRLDILVCF